MVLPGRWWLQNLIPRGIYKKSFFCFFQADWTAFDIKVSPNNFLGHLFCIFFNGFELSIELRVLWYPFWIFQQNRLLILTLFAYFKAKRGRKCPKKEIIIEALRTWYFFAARHFVCSFYWRLNSGLIFSFFYFSVNEAVYSQLFLGNSKTVFFTKIKKSRLNSLFFSRVNV